MMKHYPAGKSNGRAALRATWLALALAASVTAQHQHDAQTTTPPPSTPQTSAHEQHAPAQAPQSHAGHQHAMPMPTPAPTPTPAPAASPTPAHAHHSMEEHAGHAAMDEHAPEADGLMSMSEAGMGLRVGARRTNPLLMGQMGSGTSWQPATTPMYMMHRQAGDWLLALHGEAKLGLNHQSSARGRTAFESQNWLMPMAFRRLGPGTLQLRAMLSAEPLTFRAPGSPQLFQTGETHAGRPIIDAQHPHDLFMELSAQYTLPLGERGTWYAYFGYPGEPALGPVAFMHRASASENPSAPLAHHLADSTHISFGVLTSGITYRWLKLEASVFNGREPDENRYNFEAHPWNSRAARLSIAPNDNWTFQVSHGLLRRPEALEPGDIRRTTASVQYNRPLARGNWATSLIWGRNHQADGPDTFNLNAYTAETTLNFHERNYVYTRLELVDKNELLTHEDIHRLGYPEGFHPQFRIGAYTFGAARDVWNTGRTSIAVGGDLTLYSKPPALDALYGRTPASYRFFVRLRPAKMKMEQHAPGGATGHGAHQHE